VTAQASRRVVTGLNAQGKSCVVIDGPVPVMSTIGGMVWRSAAVPADNSGSADPAVPYSMDLMHGGGTTFMVVDFPPGTPGFFHATDTLDYIIVLKGEVVLELEEGEVTCGPGTFITQRGVVHSWRNDSPEIATIASITLPALPVGNGRTV
jgi:quercetin dioxygenase-like cupin family protein